MLTPEQTEQIKKQLILQVESTFPDDKKELAKEQIESMNAEQLGVFLKQNNLIKEGQQPEPSGKHQCIFCSIISENVESYKIDESENTIAILEINPISRGHILVIPKNHSSNEKTSREALSLAKKISKKIKKSLNPKKIEILPSELFGHKIINVLPVYENENFNSERHKIKIGELEELQKILEKKHKPKIIKRAKAEKIESEKLWLPKRIP